MECKLCPWECGADRNETIGFCGVGVVSYVARCALHMWEEPEISGTNGSGTIFFCGCNLRCLFCQNHDISTVGESDHALKTDAEGLCEMMLCLQKSGAHNINFVTPTPHIPLIAEAIRLARKRNLQIPTVYNTNSYVKVEALEYLDGLIDIYIPDLKYVTPSLAKKISGAENYPDAAKAAIAQMYRQCGQLQCDGNGIARSGVIIRHLVLPGNVDETRRVLDYIADNYPKDIHISLMSQYFPAHRAKEHPPFDRRLLKREYERAVDHAQVIGLTNVLVQDLSSANESFVPGWGEFALS